MSSFVIASNNQKKIGELRRILVPLGFDVTTVAEAGFEPIEVEENGTTFAENAFIKAKALCEYTGIAAIADDSGLCVEALGGAPGVYSARYGGGNLTDAEKNELLLNNLNNIPQNERAAYFMCSICCVYPDGEVITAEGRCDGFIATAPSGNSGFGYDPVFLLPDGRCFADISANEKDAVSHRGRALCAFANKMAGKV